MRSNICPEVPSRRSGDDGSTSELIMRAVAAAPWALECEGKGGRSSASRVYVHSDFGEPSLETRLSVLAIIGQVFNWTDSYSSYINSRTLRTFTMDNGDTALFARVPRRIAPPNTSSDDGNLVSWVLFARSEVALGVQDLTSRLRRAQSWLFWDFHAEAPTITRR